MKVHSFDDILSLVPRCSEDAIPWDDFARLGFASLFEKMEATEQNPTYHAAGNVFFAYQNGGTGVNLLTRICGAD